MQEWNVVPLRNDHLQKFYEFPDYNEGDAWSLEDLSRKRRFCEECPDGGGIYIRP